ncbi:MAG: hypothetical protein AB7F99_18805 [Vicinamibacterales bacterium]
MTIGKHSEASSLHDRLSPRRVTLVVAAAAFILLASVVIHLVVDATTHDAPWTNNDNALFLFVAQEMDHGARLYVDWREPAMPSAFLTALTAVRLSGTRFSPVLGLDFLLLATGVLGLIVLVHSLRHLKRPPPVILLAAAAYLFFVVKPGAITRDVAQREHFFALLLIPELFAIVSPARMPWRPVWLAALAFQGMNKPQLAAAVFLLEATAPRQSRSFADVIGLIAGVLAPFVMLWWQSAEAFEGFFTENLQLHLSGAYAAMNVSPRVLLARGPLLIGATAVAALVATAVATRENRELRRLSIRVSLAVVWGAATVLHQQKYFPYHFVPLFGISVVGGAWAAGEWLSSRNRTLAVTALAAILLVVGAVAIHSDIARSNADPLALRLGQAIDGGDPEKVFVASVYSHGICTPYRGAPRCVWPEALSPRLTLIAGANDGGRQLEEWAAERSAWIREARPDVLLLSTSDRALPPGVTPARILLERHPAIEPGEYVPLSPGMQAWVDARGWIVLRRSDVPEAALQGR